MSGSDAAVAGRIIGALAGSATVFVGILAGMFAITGGSAWMLACVPLVLATCGWMDYLILAPIFRSDD